MKRLLVNLPDALHEKLRREAFDKKVSMSSLILKKIEYPIMEVKPKIVLGTLRSEIPSAKIPGVGRGFCKHNAVKGLCKHGCK